MNPRQITAAALLQVERQGAYSNLTLEPFFAREDTSPQDRAFASALFYGVLERQITLDWHLSHYSKTPIAKLDPRPRAARRRGARPQPSRRRGPGKGANRAACMALPGRSGGRC